MQANSLQYVLLLFVLMPVIIGVCSSCTGEHKNTSSAPKPALNSQIQGKVDEQSLRQAINSAAGKDKYRLMCQLEDLKSRARKSSDDEALIDEILAISRENFGSDSIEYADALMRQGRRLGFKQEFARSAKAYEEAGKIFAAKGSVYDREQMACLSGRISGECAEGKCLQEVELYTELLRLRKKVLGDKNAQTVIAMTMLGEIYMRKHRYDDALKLFRDAYFASVGGTAVDKTGILLNLARSNIYLNHFSDAETLLSPILKSAEGGSKSDQINSIRLISTLKVYALLYERQKKYKDEVVVAKRILDLDGARMGTNNPALSHSLVLYADALEKAGKTKDAGSVRKRLNDLEVNHVSLSPSKSK